MNEKEAIDIIRLERSKGVADNEILQALTAQFSHHKSTALLGSVATSEKVLKYRKQTLILQCVLLIFILLEVFDIIRSMQILLLIIPIGLLCMVAVIALAFNTINLTQHVAEFYSGIELWGGLIATMHAYRIFAEGSKVLFFDVSISLLGVFIILLCWYIRRNKFPAYKE